MTLNRDLSFFFPINRVKLDALHDIIKIIVLNNELSSSADE
jgi:hypothetical protein